MCQELLNQKTTISTINKAPTITTATVHSRSTRIPVKNPQNNASPEPENSSQSFAENIGTKIRREELELMQFEETRRYLVIQEKLSSYGTQYQEQQRSPRKTVSLSQPASTPKVPQYNPFQGASQYQSVSLSPEPSLARSKSQMTPSRTPQSANFVPFQTPEFSKQASLTRQASSNSMNVPGSPVVNAKNFDAIISWLAFPRYVFLKDRHTKQEYTIVIDSEIIDTKNQEIFVLKWFEINPRDRNATSGPILDDRSVLKGYVYLQDITNIQLNGKNNKDGSNILILQLSSAARALKSSGGRTVLCLEFASESESSKYYQGIQSLQSYKRQNTAGKGGQ